MTMFAALAFLFLVSYLGLSAAAIIASKRAGDLSIPADESHHPHEGSWRWSENLGTD
jgi:hypothetical protein